MRNERQQAEQTVAALRRTVRQARALLEAATATRMTVDTNLDLVRRNDARLRAQATTLHADLEHTVAGTTTTAIGAYLTASQANNLSACLVGVSQALNQLAVGDNRRDPEPRVRRPALPAGGSPVSPRVRRALLGAGIVVMVVVLIVSDLGRRRGATAPRSGQDGRRGATGLHPLHAALTAGQDAAVESAYLAAVKLTESIAEQNVDITLTVGQLAIAQAELAKAQAFLAASTRRRDSSSNVSSACARRSTRPGTATPPPRLYLRNAAARARPR